MALGFTRNVTIWRMGGTVFKKTDMFGFLPRERQDLEPPSPFYNWERPTSLEFSIYNQSSGPLRSDRSDRRACYGPLGPLRAVTLSYSAVYSGSAYKAHGTQRATCGGYVLEGV